MNRSVSAFDLNGASAFTVQPVRRLVDRERADIALAIGVLQHGAVDEAVLDRLQHHLVMVDADHLDALVADLAQRVGGDDRRHPGRGDDAVDLAGMRREIGVDLLLGGLRRVDVGDHLHDLTAPRLLRRLVDGVDAELGVGIDQEAGEMGDAPLPPIALISSLVPR